MYLLINTPKEEDTTGRTFDDAREVHEHPEYLILKFPSLILERDLIRVVTCLPFFGL
jgi:hypothetical protein